jgi:hypothetical protein
MEKLYLIGAGFSIYDKKRGSPKKYAENNGLLSARNIQRLSAVIAVIIIFDGTAKKLCGD